MEELLCCGQPVAKSKSKTTGVFTVACKVCGRIGSGKSASGAEEDFKKAGGELPALPSGASALPQYMASRLSDMREVAVPFIANDRPALTRLIKNNVRYVMTRKEKAFTKCWETPEGQESIVHAMEEALSLGAELGKTGSLVPFGGSVEFIPAVEAYEFALTNGSSPPFGWIQIDMIHENDIRDISRINGEFSCKIKPAVPRGPLVAVAVYGYNHRLKKVIGEVYDVERLLEKAKHHSQSYQYYLRDKGRFARAKTEGKVSVDADGRRFTTVDVPTRDGGTWKKKIYEEEIRNPYEGPDQPEMLRKSAGKSFLGKYARVRNSEAAIDEIGDERNIEDAVDASISQAFKAFDTADPASAEPEPEETEADQEDIAEAESPDTEPSVEEVEAELVEENEKNGGGSLMDQVRGKVGTDKGKEDLEIF